jgi:uncharacterized protein
MLKVVVVAALLVSGGQAHAASYNCASAVTPRERLICKTPSLSAADNRMARIYATDLSAVSEKRRDALRAGQRGWLRYLAAVCPVSKSMAEAVEEDEAVEKTVKCIEQKYAGRLDGLASAVRRKGPFLFVQIDRYETSPLSPDEKTIYQEIFGRPDWRVKAHHVSYPQIDQPVTSTTTRWNELIVRSVSRLPNDGDATELRYSITLATPALISVGWSISVYEYGAAHSFDSFEAETMMLESAPHPMQPTDLFRSDRDWARRLKSEVGKVAAEYRMNADDFPQINSVATNPGRWRLTPDGLTIVFISYEMDGNPFVEIPLRWTDLQDILRPDLHLPPKAASNDKTRAGEASK